MAKYNVKPEIVIFQEVYRSGVIPINNKGIKNILEQKEIYLSMEEIGENVQRLVDRGSFFRTGGGITIPRQVLDILHEEK